VVAACGAVGATAVPILLRIALWGSLDLPVTVIASTLLTSGVVGATCQPNNLTMTVSITKLAPNERRGCRPIY